MPQWFQNGNAVELLAIDDRGLQYGDGLFETIAVRDGILRHWDLHIERLQKSCRRLDIEAPTAAALLHSATDAVNSVSDKNGILKILVTRGTGKRGYTPPADPEPTVLFGVLERVAIPDQFYRDGVEVYSCRTRLSLQPLTAGIKTLSRLDQVLASSEWRDSRAVEGIMQDQDGAFVCGTMSNLFVVQGGALRTPEISTCGVSGTMRRHILTLAQEHGMDIQTGTVSEEMIKLADEVFLCNSQFGIWPVRRLGGNALSTTMTFTDWPLTRNMMSLLRQSGVAEGPA